MKAIDTTVAIDHLRGSRAATELLSHLIESEGAVAASEIVRFELLAGVRTSEVEMLERFFQAITWIPVDESVARAASGLARAHRKSHGAIDDADYLIAATAILLDAELLTTNVRHFPMFPGLRSAY
ncbi:MAG TPA: type II toxin-antitoxin system VapC family toxin [Acidimicrobiia bacterium]|nr:type II toxin-antitoxin system VapC family toxin [Acidimicrobiia bacterium]